MPVDQNYVADMAGLVRKFVYYENKQLTILVKCNLFNFVSIY